MSASNTPATCPEPVDISNLDAFELRHEIMAGLTLSDGLRVDVIDENALIVIGTDSRPHPRHGVYMATGRLLHVTRDGRGEPWWADRYESRPLHGFGAHMLGTLTDLDDDLAWVRRRTDP